MALTFPVPLRPISRHSLPSPTHSAPLPVNTDCIVGTEGLDCLYSLCSPLMMVPSRAIETTHTASSNMITGPTEQESLEATHTKQSIFFSHSLTLTISSSVSRSVRVRKEKSDSVSAAAISSSPLFSIN